MEQLMQMHGSILMEGALGERMKREYGLAFDPHIAMAGLIYDERGRDALSTLWLEYMHIADTYQLPFLATTPTRRANRDRLHQAGMDEHVLYDNVHFLKEVRAQSSIEMYCGCLMGCHGDAYTGEGALDQKEAKRFHSWQAEVCCKAGADFLYAGIMPTLPEAVGMAEAMALTGLPYIISFTITRDGRLIDKSTIHHTIEAIDHQVSRKPLCYMANCVHPAIALEALMQPFNRTSLVRERFLGLQANTSPLTYAELDGTTDLHCAEPEAFARDMLRLKAETGIKILGGCCGTDNRHMQAIAVLMQEASTQ